MSSQPNRLGALSPQEDDILCQRQPNKETSLWVLCKHSYVPRALPTTPIIQAPDLTIPFELMVIYHASKTLDAAQANYTTAKKELLAIVFALDKF
uniref:Reverse transcriptase RNase H-like domain-containing protein n=1 Tax=Cajanus cajan TaxID=3821 RepID=A0A151R6J7_CAJCA|nr:hypothetical protein KK1_040507 [Cajanus cajan]